MKATATSTGVMKTMTRSIITIITMRNNSRRIIRDILSSHRKMSMSLNTTTIQPTLRSPDDICGQQPRISLSKFRIYSSDVEALKNVTTNLANAILLIFSRSDAKTSKNIEDSGGT